MISFCCFSEISSKHTPIPGILKWSPPFDDHTTLQITGLLSDNSLNFTITFSPFCIFCVQYMKQPPCDTFIVCEKNGSWPILFSHTSTLNVNGFRSCALNWRGSSFPTKWQKLLKSKSLPVFSSSIRRSTEPVDSLVFAILNISLNRTMREASSGLFLLSMAISTMTAWYLFFSARCMTSFNSATESIITFSLIAEFFSLAERVSFIVTAISLVTNRRFISCLLYVSFLYLLKCIFIYLLILSKNNKAGLTRLYFSYMPRSFWLVIIRSLYYILHSLILFLDLRLLLFKVRFIL